MSEALGFLQMKGSYFSIHPWPNSPRLSRNGSKIVIGFLYGDIMNTYGDTGNIVALKKRLEWRGFEVEVRNISIGDQLKIGEVDLYFFGGGQDQGQVLVGQDLPKKIKALKADVEKGVPLLAICGGYQLLGKYYQPFDGSKINGAGIFDIYTKASDDRMIGNIVIESPVVSSQSSEEAGIGEEQLLKFVGFENHSGKTFLGKEAKPLGKVIKGFGNNGSDRTEGCIYKSAIGCYMHGSLLPKNPTLADWLIEKALDLKYNRHIQLESLDDDVENNAHNRAIAKFG